MLRRQVLTWQSGRFEPSDSVPGREEVSHPPVVAQDTIDDLSSPGHDLARDPDQILEEGAKLHSQLWAKSPNALKNALRVFHDTE